MHEYDYIHGILAVLAAAIIFVPLLQRLKASPIIGYLVAGIALANSGLGIIENPDFVKSLAELGVIFLLFTIGLELSFSRIVAMRWYIFGLGMSQMLVTSIVIGLIAYWLGLSVTASMVIGMVLALSSTATTTQILSERRETLARFGRISIAVLIFQDLAVVPLLAAIPLISGDEVNLFSALSIALLKGVLAIVIILLIARTFIHPIYNLIASVKSPELFAATTLFIVFLVSLITAKAGMSMALGAFLAGLTLAESQYRHQVEADIMPFRGILLGLFFMTVGMSIELSVVQDYIVEIIVLLLVLLLVKILVLALLGMAFKLRRLLSIRISLILSQGSEFAFVVLALALQNDIVPNFITQILFAVVSLSIVTTPYLASFGKWLSEKYQTQEVEQHLLLGAETDDLSGHVIIAGFGRVGHIISQLLLENHIPFVAIDSNLERVTEARKMHLPVYYGNANNMDIMRAAKMDRASAIMVALNHQKESEEMVEFLRSHFKETPIVACCLNDTHAKNLKNLGAEVSAPEMVEPTLKLGALLLRNIGKTEKEVSEYIQKFKRQLSTEDI